MLRACCDVRASCICAAIVVRVSKSLFVFVFASRVLCRLLHTHKLLHVFEQMIKCAHQTLPHLLQLLQVYMGQICSALHTITSGLALGQKHVTPHTSHLTPHTSHLTPHTSHITHHTSHITHHTSHVTRHASHVTRHTSHVTCGSGDTRFAYEEDSNSVVFFAP